MKLKDRIGAIRFLYIIDEASQRGDYAVLDRRSMLCVSVTSNKDLAALVDMGADNYLNSPHNLRTK